MRRNDREITDFEEILAVMQRCDVCRLALHDEPYPYILPLNFGMEVEGGQIALYFHGANAGKKYELIARDPHVSFEMGCGHQLVLDEETGFGTVDSTAPRPVFCVFRPKISRTFWGKCTEKSSRKKLAVGGFEPKNDMMQ